METRKNKVATVCKEGVLAKLTESRPKRLMRVTGMDADGVPFSFIKEDAERYLLKEDNDVLIYRGDIFYGFDGKYTTMFCSTGTQAITLEKSKISVTEC